MLEFHSNPPVATAGSPASSMLSLLNLNSLAAGLCQSKIHFSSNSYDIISCPHLFYYHHHLLLPYHHLFLGKRVGDGLSFSIHHFHI